MCTGIHFWINKSSVWITLSTVYSKIWPVFLPRSRVRKQRSRVRICRGPGFELQRSRVRIRHLPQWSWCAAGSLWNKVENLRVERETYPWDKKKKKVFLPRAVALLGTSVYLNYNQEWRGGNGVTIARGDDLLLLLLVLVRRGVGGAVVRRLHLDAVQANRAQPSTWHRQRLSSQVARGCIQ